METKWISGCWFIRVKPAASSANKDSKSRNSERSVSSTTVIIKYPFYTQETWIIVNVSRVKIAFCKLNSAYQLLRRVIIIQVETSNK